MSNRTLLITTCLLLATGCEEEELRAIPPATIQSDTFRQKAPRWTCSGWWITRSR